jgi:hypothetical protein
MKQSKFSDFFLGLIKDRKKLILILLLVLNGSLVITTTFLIFSNNQGGNSSFLSSSSASPSTSNTHSSDVPSPLLNDFSFDDANFVNSFPLGFRPIRFIEGHHNQILSLGFSTPTLLEINDKPSLPQFIVMDEAYNPLHNYILDIGIDASVSYLNRDLVGITGFHQGARLDNGDFLVFGQLPGYLLNSNNEKISLGGIFSETNILETTENIQFFIKIDAGSYAVSLVDVYQSIEATYNSFSQELTFTDPSSFFLAGQTTLKSGLFINNPSHDFPTHSSLFIIKFSYINGAISILDDFYLFNSGSTQFTRSLYSERIIYFTGNTLGNTGSFSAYEIQGNTYRFPFVGAINLEDFSFVFLTVVSSRIFNTTDFSSGFTSLGSLVIGHNNELITTALGQTGPSHALPNANVSSILLMNRFTGVIDQEINYGATGFTTGFFIGQTVSGYFILGGTSATRGLYASNGRTDILMVLLNQSFSVTKIVAWGGSEHEGIASWPMISSKGTLFFAAYTTSRDGTFASLTSDLLLESEIIFLIELK